MANESKQDVLSSGGAPAELPVLDLEQLLDRCMGHVDFAERLLTKFESRVPAAVEQIVQGAAAGDGAGVARVAHQLKGAAANVAAGRLHRVVSDIEEASLTDALGEIESLVRDLQGEWAQFVQVRSGILAGGDSPQTASRS